MSVLPIRNQHRHFKTLILLVVSMTLSTVLLFWIDKLAPGQPPTSLRSVTSRSRAWSQIAVRQSADDRPLGFFHLRIDDRGRMFQTSAWKYAQPAPDQTDTVHIVLSNCKPGTQCTTAQSRKLTEVMGKLRRDHAIPDTAIQLLAPRTPTSR